MSLFSQGGFDGTTTRKLARKAGISEALIFRHFPDKENLYEAILQKKMDEQVPVLLADLPVQEGPEVLLTVMARRIVRLHEDDPSFLRLLLFSFLEKHELSELFFKKRNLPVVEFVTRYFKDAIRRGQMRETDPETSAFAFTAMLFGFIQTRILFKIPQVMREPPEERIGRYIDLFLKGILP